MENLTETTTGTLQNLIGILDYCGDYAGQFQDSAFDIFEEIWDAELNSWDGNQWMDIMYNSKKEVFAVWAEDSLTCQNAWCYYIKLDRQDCVDAFINMEIKKS